MNQKGFISSFLILVIVLGGFLVAFGYYLGQRSSVQKASLISNITNIVNPTPSPSNIPDDEAAYVERGSPLDNRALNSTAPDVTFHGPRDKKKIALTFDAEMTDGMKANVLSGRVKSSYDKRITDTLIKTNTKATLFLTGEWIELYPGETKQLSQNPLFEFGSHSYNDSSYQGYCYGLKSLPNTVKVEDIGSTEKLLREYAGIDNRFFRFPGGCYSQQDVDLVKQANDIVIHWDVAGSDGFNNDANQIVKNVVDNVQNGSIIILHMNGEPTAPKTAEALPLIITSLRNKGFEFVKVSELLGVPPPPKVPYAETRGIDKILGISEKVIQFVEKH